MNKTVVSILIGIALGSLPLWGSAILYYGIPLMVTNNPGSLLSFGALIFYVLSLIAVLITSLIFTVRHRSITGLAGISALLLQFIVMYFMFSTIE